MAATWVVSLTARPGWSELTISFDGFTVSAARQA